MTKSTILFAALMAGFAAQGSSKPVNQHIKLASRDAAVREVVHEIREVVPEAKVKPRYTPGQNRAAPARAKPNPPEHHIYPAYLLQQHEVRKGVGEYVSDVFSNPSQPADAYSYGLRDSESFYWGLGGYPLANYTTYASSSDYRMLSLERHRDILNDAVCDTDSVTLTFSDQKHFEQVEQAWGWVNQHDAHTILLVTDNSECNQPDGDETLRQPWSVSSIAFDSATGHVTLSATPKTWEEAFGEDWRLEGGSQPIVANAPQAPQPAQQKRFTISGSPKVQLAHSLDGTGIDIPDTPLTLSCDPCHTTGELDFVYAVVPYISGKLGGTFQVTGNGIGVDIAAKLSASAGYAGKDFQKTLLDIPIPDAGISIAGLVNLGFQLTLDISGNVGKIDAEVEASAGISVTIPDGSIYLLNFDDSSKDQNSGWAPQVSPILEISGDVALSMNVGPMLTLECDAKAGSLGGSIGLALAGPNFGATATVLADSAGVCGNPDAKAGVEFDMNISADIHAFESANLIVAHPAATQTFFATSWPVFSTCITSLGGGATTTSSSSPTTSSAPFPIPSNGTNPSR